MGTAFAGPTRYRRGLLNGLAFAIALFQQTNIVLHVFIGRIFSLCDGKRGMRALVVAAQHVGVALVVENLNRRADNADRLGIGAVGQIKATQAIVGSSKTKPSFRIARMFFDRSGGNVFRQDRNYSRDIVSCRDSIHRSDRCRAGPARPPPERPMAAARTRWISTAGGGADVSTTCCGVDVSADAWASVASCGADAVPVFDLRNSEKLLEVLHPANQRPATAMIETRAIPVAHDKALRKRPVSGRRQARGGWLRKSSPCRRPPYFRRLRPHIGLFRATSGRQK